MQTEYQQAKKDLKQFAQSIKDSCKGDKPLYRMSLNDYTDSITRDSHRNLSEHKKNLLHNFCASLHPKN